MATTGGCVRKAVGGIFAVLGCLAFLSAAGQGQNISTVAGGGPPNSTTATSTPIGFPWAAVQDASGNTYVSDNWSNRIFKIDSSGKFTVIAGNTVNNFLGDGGVATAASLSKPEGIAVDSKGNVYIADTGNNVVRVVNTQASSISVAGVTISAGNIATVAGTGAPCSSSTATCGDAGAATAAQLNAPGGVAVDSSGNIFIADTGDNRIREAAASGIITTFAGTGTACATSTATCGDGAAATSSQLNAPGGIAVDGSGNVFIADTSDHRIREVVSGTISTFAGNGTACSSATAACGDAGAAASAQLNLPGAIAVDASGNVFIADTSDHRIREVVSGTISTVAGNGLKCASAPCGDGAPAISATLNFPSGVFVNASGDLIIADQNDDAIREVTAPVSTGNIATMGGVYFNRTYYGDGGAATSAELQKPFGLNLDAAGDIFIADAGNSAIRKVDTKGNISTVAGTGQPCITKTCGDLGAASAATLLAPTDVFVASSGNIFIADSQDNAIRVVNTSTTTTLKVFAGTAYELDIAPGDIATVAGNTAAAPCSKAPCGDGAAARNALLNNPTGVFLDKNGNIYIADSGDNVVRVVNTQSSAITIAGVTIQPADIAAVAGNYTVCASSTTACGDGAGAPKAQLNNPSSVYLDSSGTIYIVDTTDNKIRVVNPQSTGSVTVAGVNISAGDIATIAGTGALCTVNGCGDSNPATSAQLSSPGGVLTDNAGEVFVADSGDSLIRRISAAGNIQTVAGNGSFGFSGDGGAATSAALARPIGVGADAAGNLYIADFGEWRVRKVAGIVNVLNGTTTTLSATAASVNVGASVTLTATVTHSTGAAVPTGKVTFSNGGTNVGSGTLDNTGKATYTTSALAAGSYSITAAYSGDTTYAASTSAAVALNVQDFSIAASPATVTVSSPGQSGTATLTITPAGNFNQTLSFSCSGLPTGANCAFSSVSSTSEKVTISTTAATSQLEQHFGKGPLTFYALLMPGLLGVAIIPAVGGKRKLRGTRTLVLLLLLALGVLWMPACGGSSSSGGGGGGGGGGTPAGTSTVTITATTGGNSPLSHTTTITLTVQ